MPQPHDDEGLVPPVKILRKRLNGVYRADGFSGPTRRYVLLVALLVGLASLPTLAAITAGSNELDDGTTGAMDVPFLPPPSTGPVVPMSPSGSPSPTVWPWAPPASDAEPGTVSGSVQGQAGRRRTRPSPAAAEREESDGARYERGAGGRPATAGGARPTSEDEPPGNGVADPGDGTPRPSGDGRSEGGSTDLGKPSDPGPVEPADPGPVEPADPGPVEPVDPGPDEPTDPATPASPARPACHERGDCGSRLSRHLRPDRSRRHPCEEWADRPARQKNQVIPSSRRPAVTERPSNVRPARQAERTHNSRRHHAAPPSDGPQPASASYRGIHRAERQDRAEDSPAHHRGSRVGRHHVERTGR